MADVIYDDYNLDPTLAAFHAPRTIAAWSAILTETGEVKFVRIERAIIHEDAPLLIDDTTRDDDDEQ